MNPVHALQEAGQSVWLDYIRRDLIASGELRHLIDEGIRGVTSNPSIFEKAIASSQDYDADLAYYMEIDACIEPASLFDRIAVEDIRGAADALRPVYDASDRVDGYISLEVSPSLARDAKATVTEARRLWETVDRPNLMIKVPATPEGVVAVEELIAEGINVNVTLLFSLDHYEQVAAAYIRGLERAEDPSGIASVASFFVSRVDTAVDRLLEDAGTPEALAMRGTIAVANAKVAYRRYQELFEGEPFENLASRGARPQRVLWASTGTKNPAYSDVLYVEELVGPNTVNTVPPVTLAAFHDHGVGRGATLTEDVGEAVTALQRLTEVGVDLSAVTDELQDQGLAAFSDSFHQLLHALYEKSSKLRAGVPDDQSLSLAGYDAQVEKRLERWANSNFARGLWSKDHRLWVEEPQPEIVDRLGWLTLPETMEEVLDDFVTFAKQIRSEGFEHVVLLGMGGSSLAPEVYQATFGNRTGYPELLVLDSTHPAAVGAMSDRIDPATTLFIVASKSGNTIEPLSFLRYFWKQVSGVTDRPGDHFIAITDPGSSLVDLAREHRFRRVFEATPDVGGRYSALTAFGLVPAAIIGVDVRRLVDHAWRMMEASAVCVPESHSPALRLGATLGELALDDVDKVTFLVSPSLAAFPSWLEQLVAESTGKDSTGILPVADEPVGTPDVYGGDRFFVYLAYVGDQDDEQAAQVDALEEAGYPVARIRLYEKEDIGAEIFRAELAVAAASSVMGIHPFNQPDVQHAKELARRAMAGGLDAGDVDEVSVDDIQALDAAVAGWLSTARPGDYVSLQAYLQPGEATTETLGRIRLGLRDQLGIATTVGYGPRFLHSTGQFHKGGTNSGLFLQLVDDTTDDVEVPDAGYTFGELIAAQSLGDYQALITADRRVLRVNLGSDPVAGLAGLEEALDV
jgi:transaldolase/glucose-6-phosphate isomerase